MSKSPTVPPLDTFPGLPLKTELLPEEKAKAVILKRIGFSLSDIAMRLSASVDIVTDSLANFKPDNKLIDKLENSIIENISKELSTGFVSELKAIDDLYYWAVNKLLLKVKYDSEIPAKELTTIAKFAYDVQQGNPADQQARQLFLSLNLTNQQIFNIANGTTDNDQQSKPGTGTKETIEGSGERVR